MNSINSKLLDPSKLNMVRMIKRFYSVLIFFMLVAGGTQAQDYSAYNWYFGNSALGLRFTKADTAATATLVNDQHTTFGNGGSAVATDPVSGNVIFYTDGVKVVDASNQTMSGSPITGTNTRNQPVAICKNPTVKGQYLIFSNNGTLRVSAVDSVASGNETFQQPVLWNVTAPKNQVVAGVPAGLSEAMIMLYDQSRDDFWLMTHETGTTNYHFVRISETGISYEGFVSIGLIENAANFSYHPATNRIAVSPREANRDVEVLTLAFPATVPGLPTLAGVRVVNSNVTTITTEGIYDTEFSSSGQYLYVSFFDEGATGDVRQFDLTNPTLTAQSVLSPKPTQSYGLQMGPDGKIYHLYQSGASTFLGVINSPDSSFTAVDYDPIAFAGNFNGRQFPSFAPADSIDMKVFFTADGTCANAPTAFFPTVIPGADSLNWDFGDGGTSSDWAPVYTYTADGTYDVLLSAFLNGQQKDTTLQVIIQPFDAQISLVQDTTACSCELPFPKAPNPPPPCSPFSVTANITGTVTSWQWYGPEGAVGAVGSGNQAVLFPPSAGYYYLVATSGSCQTYAGVNIKEYGVQDQRANFWYFGQNAGIDFNPVFDVPPLPPQAVSNPVMNAPEGTSTISDRNGQVIFFTDGDRVWDRNFTEIASGIGGEVGSSQSALIIPVPGDETLYYIFTTEEIYGGYEYRLSYSLFDLKLNNGTGGMRETNVTLFYPSTERITSDGNWLVAHEYGNNTFRAYEISATGIGSPVISSIGSDHSTANAVEGQGYMKFGPDGKLAVAYSTGTNNFVELFDFVDSTGVVTNFRSIDLNATGQVYGVEFFGDKLFASVFDGNTSKVFEYYVDSVGVVHDVPPASPPNPLSSITVNDKLGAIQTGPDGQVYVAVQGKNYLKTILPNGDPDSPSAYGPDFPLTNTSGLGLPNFAQVVSDQLMTPSLSITGFCLGDSTNFSVGVSDPIDVVTYTFGDGAGASGTNLTSVAHLYGAPGIYNVVVRIENRCIGLVQQYTRTIQIFAPPADPTSVLSLCTPPETLDANLTNAPNLSYLWETGATTETIDIFQTGVYNVTVTDNVSGCTTDGAITVFPSLAVINLGPDETYCSGTIAGPSVMNTGININQHKWFLNGVDLNNTGPTQAVNITTAGVFTYIVEFDDTGNSGCFVRDTVTYTVTQSPILVTTANNPIDCSPADGEITFDIQPALTQRYSYSIAGGPSGYFESNINLDGGIHLSNSNTLEAGTYSVQVTDQVNGCLTTSFVILTNDAFTVTPISKSICSPEAIDVTSTAPAGSSYRVINTTPGSNNGVEVVPPTVNVTGGNFTTPVLPAGSYIIEVSSAGNCIIAAAATLTQGTQFTIGTNEFDISGLCNATPQVTVNPSPAASTFDWSASQGTTGITNGATVTLTTTSGVYNLKVTVGGPGLCPTTGEITVTIDGFTPAFTVDPCILPVVLVAAPTNGAGTINDYIYTWTGTTSGNGQQFNVGSTPNNYSYTLTMRSLLSGCLKTSQPVSFQIPEPITVFIDPIDIPCDGAPFGLAAVTTGTIQSYQWSFNGTPVGTGPQLLNRTQGGLYSVAVTNNGTCFTEAELDVFLAPSTPGKLFDEAMICPEEANPDPNTREARLDPGAGFVSYEWFEIINNAQSPLGFTDQVYVSTEEGIYEVRLENTIGCFSTDRTTVTIECDPVLVGPNAFRPTNPAASENQQFSLLSFFIDDSGFQIYIFNRWGEMVFQSDDRLFAWNGGYNNNAGQLLPAGTYTYVVRYKSAYRPQDGVKEKRGGVMLLR